MAETYSQLAVDFKENKSNEAFEKLYKKMKPGLYNYIFGFVKDRDVTRDLLSDAFIKVYTEIDRYEPEKGQITTWAFRIARNDCLSYIKKIRKKSRLEVIADKGISPTSDREFIYGQYYELEDIKTDKDFLAEENELQTKYNLAIENINNLKPLYKDIIYDRLINKMDYKSIMFKHDSHINKYKIQFENNEISEKTYNKEYKRALQRIKNKIRRGREMLANLIEEAYKTEFNYFN